MTKTNYTWLLGTALVTLSYFDLYIASPPKFIDLGSGGLKEARLRDDQEIDFDVFQDLEPLQDKRRRITEEYSTDFMELVDKFSGKDTFPPSWKSPPLDFSDLYRVEPRRHSGRPVVKDSVVPDAVVPITTTPPEPPEPPATSGRSEGQNFEEPKQNELVAHPNPRDERVVEPITTKIPPSVSQQPSERAAHLGNDNANQWKQSKADVWRTEMRVDDMWINGDFDSLSLLTSCLKAENKDSEADKEFNRFLGEQCTKLEPKNLGCKMLFRSRSKAADFPIVMVPRSDNVYHEDKQTYLVQLLMLQGSKEGAPRSLKTTKNTLLKIFRCLIIAHQLADINKVWNKLLGVTPETSQEHLIRWFKSVLFEQTQESLPLLGWVKLKMNDKQKIEDLFGNPQHHLSRFLVTSGQPSATEVLRISTILLENWYRVTAAKLGRRTLQIDGPDGFWSLMATIRLEEDKLNELLHLEPRILRFD
ncbi:hypothetical protein PSTG_02794 [Puccinia striiformis f. sp. tritici PST-78]|uniref:Uncharacterized protein n=1 Tax=Puccinia striiformis f. sp. tritici PST-78 TaxID=1165861 RepID=A0A0L0VXR1_9BASI|nr:hypothetical protein PSTG_02794 [Puccinia striiformis f. sp. tritici PST-78]